MLDLNDILMFKFKESVDVVHEFQNMYDVWK